MNSGGDSPISDSGDIIPSNLPSPLSCPRHPNNSKCYPIWETELSDEEKSESRDPSSLLDYKIQPILRTSSQHPFLGFKVRSVTLSWPDGMKHAIFFTDDSCQELSIRRPDVLWHVERYETQSKQCQSIPEGLFKSIEFMRQDEYEIFMKRMQGKDDGIGGASWRGIF